MIPSNRFTGFCDTEMIRDVMMQGEKKLSRVAISDQQWRHIGNPLESKSNYQSIVESVEGISLSSDFTGSGRGSVSTEWNHESLFPKVSTVDLLGVETIE